MENKKIIQHIENKQFNLKDFQKTFNRYKNYKVNFVNDFFKDNENDILNHLSQLESLIKNKLQENEQNKNFIFNMLYERELNKSVINMFKTTLNSITFNINKEFIDYQGEFNKNQIKNLTIILYLRHYKEINEKMKNVFKEFFLNYNSNKCIYGLIN